MRATLRCSTPTEEQGRPYRDEDDRSDQQVCIRRNAFRDPRQVVIPPSRQRIAIRISVDEEEGDAARDRRDPENRLSELFAHREWRGRQRQTSMDALGTTHKSISSLVDNTAPPSEVIR